MLDVQVRRLRARWAGLRRDTAMVALGLVGRHPSPLIRVRGSTAPAESLDRKQGGAHLGAGSAKPADRLSAAARDAALATAHPATIRAAGRSFDVAVEAGQTILEAGRAADVPLKFSCTVGGCGTCRSKLLNGRVDLKSPNCLTDEEVAAGYILPCVSRPLEAVTVAQ